MCAISKEWVLNYDTNNHANISTICKYLRNNVSRNILQYHEITGIDTTLFSYTIGKLTHSKKSLKNQLV